MTFSKQAVAVVAFAAGLLFAGATAYGIGQSVSSSEGGSNLDQVQTVNYGSN